MKSNSFELQETPLSPELERRSRTFARTHPTGEFGNVPELQQQIIELQGALDTQGQMLRQMMTFMERQSRGEKLNGNLGSRRVHSSEEDRMDVRFGKSVYPNGVGLGLNGRREVGEGSSGMSL